MIFLREEFIFSVWNMEEKR